MEMTPKQRYRVSEKGRAENRERMRRRRAYIRAFGTGAADLLRCAINATGWWPCAHCGEHLPACMIEVDHTVPLIGGGTDTADNVQGLCVPCHRAKTASEHAGRKVAA